MTKFRIYDFSLQAVPRQRRIGEDEESQKELTPQEAQNAFASLVNDKAFKFIHTKVSGEVEDYPDADRNLIGGITVLKLQNIKHFLTQINYEDREFIGNPWCWAIVDHRPGRFVIALERGRGWRNPDKLRDLLLEWYNPHLEDKGVRLSIEPRKDPGEAFEVVERRLRVQGEHLKFIRYEFPKPDTDLSKRGTEEQKTMLRLMSEYFGLTEGSNSFFQKNGTAKNPIVLSPDNATTVAMVNLFSHGDYGLTLGFSKSQVYRWGQLINVEREITERTLEAFMNGQLAIGEGMQTVLSQWLDEIEESTVPQNLAKKTDNAHTAIPRRQRR